jgi:hypothetical protein
MAKYNINIAKQVYENTFGYYQVPKVLGFDQRIEKSTNRYGTQLDKPDEYGNNMFSPVTLKWGNNEITLPYSTVSISGSKKIVNTELVNRQGSVNEQISINDYQFQINGVVVTRQERLPEDWLALFKQVFETSEPVEIINPITDFYLRENQNIIILNHNLPDMRGIEYAQSYSFKAKTDTNLELIIE